MKNLLLIATVAFAALMPAAGRAADAAPSGVELAVRDIERSIVMLDASWSKSIKGSYSNCYMADTYDTATGRAGGASDIWPLTAAVEAHNSILEALNEVRTIRPELYADNYGRFAERLAQLIDNLEWYKGTAYIKSYANYRPWSVYAVPRAGSRGGANITGVLNVYDDQMWLCRELIRAYMLTDNQAYLDQAAYLADYVIDGWDCTLDANGEEYGGITWGPGYNSKHSCSNGPIVQPLVWLYEIYKDSSEEMEFTWLNDQNEPQKTKRNRAEVYLEFASKIYYWQRKHLLAPEQVYYDMMGAVTGEIQYTGRFNRYRKHVDSTAPGGTFYPYNTGTMIGGAAELYRINGDESLIDELSKSVKASVNRFSTTNRKIGGRVFKTDNSAREGFLTWFNNVLMRGLVDAAPYVDDANKTYLTLGIEGFQKSLDYGYENFLVDGMLPIKLASGWGTETITKGFHQFTFAAQFALLAKKLLQDASSSIDAVAVDGQSAQADGQPHPTDAVYNLQGVCLGQYGQCFDQLPAGLYICHGRKLIKR